MPNNLKCKIIEKKGEKVLVEIDNQIITLPKESFPENLKINDEFHVNFWNGKTECQDKKLAKEILEEILNGK